MQKTNVFSVISTIGLTAVATPGSVLPKSVFTRSLVLPLLVMPRLRNYCTCIVSCMLFIVDLCDGNKLKTFGQKLSISSGGCAFIVRCGLEGLVHEAKHFLQIISFTAVDSIFPSYNCESVLTTGL